MSARATRSACKAGDAGSQYLATAWGLDIGGLENRVRGVVLLDALYGELDKFVAWIANNRTAFFVSAYTDSTQQNNMTLKTILTEHEIPVGTVLNQNKWKQGVTFLATNPEVKHEDFVTQAWLDYPIKTYCADLTNIDADKDSTIDPDKYITLRPSFEIGLDPDL